MAMREFAFSPDGPKYRLVLLHHEMPNKKTRSKKPLSKKMLSKNPFLLKPPWTHFLRCPQCGQRAGSLFLHQDKLFCRPCLDHPRQPRPLEERIRNAEQRLIGYRGSNYRSDTILTLRRSLIKLRRQQLGLPR
jgi:hypothetical protein